jgi:MFS family permease
VRWIEIAPYGDHRSFGCEHHIVGDRRPIGRSRDRDVPLVGASFLVNGISATVWLAATPQLAADFDTTVGTFGIAFVALALGGIGGTLAAARLIGRFGAGRTTVWAGFAVAAALALRAAPSTLPLFVAAQVVAGLADGVHDVSMNEVAVRVDARYSQPIVNRLHGVWSIGTIGGALLGTLLAALGADPWAFFVVGALLAAVVNATTMPLARDRARVQRGARAEHVRIWSVKPLVVLAVMGIAVSVLEGAPLDWGALYLTDEIGATAGLAAGATVTYTAGMVLTRLGGDHLVHRFGVPQVLRVGALAAAAAIGVALAFNGAGVVLIAWFVAGAGVATCYPALYVAAGRTPGLPPGAGIGAVASVARVGFLLGPAAVGLLADAASLRVALLVPVVAAVLVAIAADAARRPPS